MRLPLAAYGAGLAYGGLLKALGFVRRQVAAAVCWQATTVALTGIMVGAPADIAAARVLWRVFATNFGVIPVAARSQPAQLLRAE